VQDCPPVLDIVIETLDADELAALQEMRLLQQWGYVRESSEFYAGRLPDEISLDWLQDVGFTDKEELRASQLAGPPFGDYVAADLADVGATNEPTDLNWLPLGVFAMVRNEQQHPHLIMQLAINRQGMLRGNYTDEVSEGTQPIRGAVDQRTQRAAWIVGNHKTLVMEAGLSNLSEGDAPALIHKNGKTDHWLLVRLKQPTNDKTSQ